MVEQHMAGTNGQAGLVTELYRSARQVLEDGLQALGGLEAISEIRNVTIVENGTHYEIDESPSADPPSTTSRSIGNDRHRFEQGTALSRHQAHLAKLHMAPENDH